MPRLAPTSAAASTRGSRVRKKICASTLSANGCEPSNTRASEMCVLPASGANRQAIAASDPNPATVAARRRRTSVDAANRYHRHVPGARVVRHLDGNVKHLADDFRSQDAPDVALCDDAAAPDQNQLGAK